MISDRRSANPQGFWDNVLDYMVQVVMQILPHFPAFNGFKAFLMRSRGASVGKRCKFFQGIWMDRFRDVSLGDDVSLAVGICMVTSGGIRIGHRAMIGYKTVILSVNHAVPEGRAPMRFSGAENRQVTIGDDAWIGANATIMPGVTIGTGAIIGAGSVVTNDIPEYAVAVGVPARVLRLRD